MILLKYNSLSLYVAERRLALLSGHSGAMVVVGGYIANLAWISLLIGSDDLMIYDKNSHASTLDALKLANVSYAYTFNTDKIETLKRSL